MSSLPQAAIAFVAVLAAVVALRRLARPPARLARPARTRDRVGPELGRWRERIMPSPPQDTALAALLEDVAGSLRSGTSLAAALRDAARTCRATAPGLAAALARVERGATLAAALEHWRDGAADPAARLAATVLGHVASLGGADPRPLEAVADTLCERVALRGELRTQAAQPRASAAVLSGLPPAFLVVVALADPDVAHVVLRTPLGWTCLAAGLMLDAVGALWMARIVHGAAP